MKPGIEIFGRHSELRLEAARLFIPEHLQRAIGDAVIGLRYNALGTRGGGGNLHLGFGKFWHAETLRRITRACGNLEAAPLPARGTEPRFLQSLVRNKVEQECRNELRHRRVDRDRPT